MPTIFFISFLLAVVISLFLIAVLFYNYQRENKRSRAEQRFKITKKQSRTITAEEMLTE